MIINDRTCPTRQHSIINQTPFNTFKANHFRQAGRIGSDFGSASSLLERIIEFDNNVKNWVWDFTFFIVLRERTVPLEYIDIFFFIVHILLNDPTVNYCIYDAGPLLRPLVEMHSKFKSR